MTTLLQQAFAQHQKGLLDQAELLYQKILKQNPGQARVLFLLGSLKCQKKDYDGALNDLNKAIARQPDFAEAYNSLGNVQQMQTNFSAAEKSYRKALSLKPDMISARDNLVRVLVLSADECHRRFQLAQARAKYEEALGLVPDHPDLLNRYGVLLKDMDEPEMAIPCYEKILKLKPGELNALGNLAHALKETGQHERALKCLNEFLQRSPGDVRARFNRSLLLWDMMDYANAFSDLDARLETERHTYVKKFKQPLWQGQSLTDKRLLVYLEQGLGEQVSAALLLKDVLPICGSLFVEGDPRLVAILERSIPGVRAFGVESRDASPFFCDDNIDFQVPSWSLYRHFRKSAKDFPAHQGYLKVNPDLKNKWRDRIAHLEPGLKVGIAWQSSAAFVDAGNQSLRQKSSVPLEQLCSAVLEPEVRLVSLQYGDVQAELGQVREKQGHEIVTWPDLDVKNDLENLAAMIVQLDVVVAINSFVAYFANALGKKVLMPCHAGFKAGWPTIFNQDPEYPHITYFRQERRGDWDRTLENIHERLLTYLT